MTKGLVTVASAKRKSLYLLLRLALHRCRCEYLSRLYKLQYRLDLSLSEHISLVSRFSTSVSVTSGQWWHGPLKIQRPFTKAK